MEAKLCVLLIVALMIGNSLQGKRNCPRICPAVYSPICAGDGRTKVTFSNNCLLNSFNCNKNKNLIVLKPGKC